MEEALALILAYLIGSIPMSWLIFYWRTGKDLRTVGDGNVGSANAIREYVRRGGHLIISLPDWPGGTSFPASSMIRAS